MKENCAIEVRNVSKSFRIYKDKSSTLMESLLFWKRREYEKRAVIRDISFEINRGEAIGLIGHNGCGKSTMLKLLSKILYPDSGRIEINGRVSSLIELGAGFHPDMSGRENIYINASIFGLSRKEIDNRIGQIIDFSELEEYIDNPVRTYSSGMYARLAFSIAINVDANVLLVDEILGVGDAAFQAKCFNKMREIKANGVTIVIVSHSLGQIEQLCDRCIWIDDGKVKMDGNALEVDLEYLDNILGVTTKSVDSKRDKKFERVREYGNKKVEIVNASMTNPLNGQNVFKTGDDAVLSVEYDRKDDTVESVVLGVNIIRNDGQYCYGTTTLIEKRRNILLYDKGKISIEFNDILLLKGRYTMDISFSDGVSENYHYIYKAVKFEIINPIDELGVSRLKHKWHYDE